MRRLLHHQTEYRAEETAVHFPDRFNQTLDFGVPYREMCLKESISRGEKVGTSPAEIAKEKLNDDIEIAMMDLWCLRNAYLASHEVTDLPPDIKAAHGEELIPYMQDQDERRKKRRLKDPDHFLRTYLYNARKLANLYRHYLSPAMFASPLYKARNDDFAQRAGTSRVRVEKSYAYAAFENHDVYRAWHAGIEDWLVEVDGQVKVLHINPLPGFRWSP